ncbi:FecR family protein [Flavivirga sp. 57AJ16]|uniref:FecR family protein n=1 Tax=Flavivirga sp. 57AJ16 TaxID=3025307 RepID=UPI0023658230|nr:FecR domain-containing protein [Flavivirga sp. 57AJ16]MDD7885391.1 FecR domain-containing protein [Flavivirga sp. 57AJ16]
MNEQQFKNLLEKQKQNKLSDKEKKLFDEFENNLLSRNRETVFANEAHKKEVKKAIHKKVNYKIKIKKGYNWLNIAASITLLISLALGFSYYKGGVNHEPALVLDSENVILQLENGNIQIINEDAELELVDADKNVIGKQTGNQLVYSNESKTETLVYNTLKVPYGKRFEIRLSDGTTVHLNSGTSLKYPVKFIKGKNRQVYLLEGEAYFSVTKDTGHPFLVNANEINVRVLGTEFNISSYHEDNQINTVLVEGSVNIYPKDDTYNTETATKLKPGFMAVLQKANNQITIDKADIEMHIAWIDGRIVFRHMPFKNVIKKLERHYNVVINNSNKELGEKFLTASFDIETIQEVLETLNTSYNIKYSINNNQITIN